MFHDNALYIHVPFCKRKCEYCSFVSEEGREKDIPLYSEALVQEIALRVAGKKIMSIYFGGGTPSLLSGAQIEKILSVIRSTCLVKRDAEITIEANPGTVDHEYLSILRQSGINRLSLGIQSFNDSELALLGRIHSAVQAEEIISFARAAGFDNLSIDLIYGLPGQKVREWHTTLEHALTLNVEHISLYALTLEHDVPMQISIDDGSLPSPDPDIAADQYELAQDMLKKAGYVHYEISNWARSGKECRHNLVYWGNKPYIGVGVAAHSCFAGHRSANTVSIDRYLDAYRRGGMPAMEMDEVITTELELAETMIMGLRLCRGVECAALRRRFNIDIEDYYGSQFDELVKYGLLERRGGRISLTRRGRLLSNEAFWRFLPDAQVPVLTGNICDS